MKVHEAIRRFLVAEGVDTVFSYLSDATVELVANLQAEEHGEETIDVVEARHEQSAVAMADGYARTTGEIGVVVVGRGPAIAQTGTALVTALKGRSPVLVVTAGAARAESHDPLNKDFPQQSYLETMLDNVLAVPDDAVVVQRFAEAFRRLDSGAGPVAVQLPSDLIGAETDRADDWTESTIGSPRHSTAGTRFEPDPAKVETAVDRYLDSDASSPPVVLAGRGAVRADAKAALRELAERTGALLATTLQAQGYFSDDPFSVGFVGTFGPNVANEHLVQSDYVLAVGCSLNHHTTDSGRLLEGSTVVQVDTAPGHIERYVPVDVGIVGDAKVTAETLAAEFADLGIDFADRFRTDTVRRRIERASPFDDREFPYTPGRLDPRDLVRRADDLLPDDRLVVTDTGHFMAWVFDGITIPDPGDYLWTADFGSVGLGQPMGIGATLASRDDDRTTLVFCGDGGFLMSLAELNTAVRQDLPMVVVVFNDDGLGAEYQRLVHGDGGPTDAAVIETPELATVAEGFGAAGHTVRSVEDLEALAGAFDPRPDGPVVLDCKVDRDVYHRFFDSHA